MARASIFVATVLLAGCQSRPPEAPRPVDERPVRLRVAQAEARRGGGVAELVELAGAGDVETRALALRGLGRVGGAEAIAALEGALADGEPRVVAAALGAMGIAGSLDEDTSWKPGAAIEHTLDRGDRVVALAALEALGRAGEPRVQATLAREVASVDHEEAAAAALALGRHGRRKLAIEPAARTALIAATAHQDARVRYAATYALAREHEPPPDGEANAALAVRIFDDEPEIRATAIAGLARRKAVATGRTAIEDALRDSDWRVAVEAVRALAGPSGDATGRVAVAGALVRRQAELAAGSEVEGQVLVEALRVLLQHPITDKASLDKIGAVAAAVRGASVAATTRQWIDCLAIAVTMPPSARAVDAIASCSLPDHHKLPLLGELVDPGRSDAGFRRAALRVLLAHDDPRVRGAGLAALPGTWNDGPDQGKTIVGTIASAIGANNAIVAGTAIEAASAVYDAMGAAHPLQPTLDAAVIARAATEDDVELAAALYGVIGKRKLAGGADACRAGLAAAPARARAAAECLRALGDAVAPPGRGPAEPPPVEVAAVLGKRLHWKLVTSRGELVIELVPEVAPWAVATIAELTRRGAYDGVEFHRVVPNFVVQGGDPTESGWGGPGFTLPAEPATGADGHGFAAGGVGVADAGRDSGGSQWFAMHSRAPHLDARYTWIGTVIAGHKSADALLIGDEVVKATVEQR